jgi:O-antigen/teichoic acid export membrane protein
LHFFLFETKEDAFMTEDGDKTNDIKTSDSKAVVVNFNKEGWLRPGFHRPLAGMLYNLIYVITAAGFGIILTIWLMPNVVYPFPEAMGFEDLVVQMFSVYFTLLDLGIGAAIQRFVAEENIKSPRKAIQYIQFFIWYQMFSGLLQVSFIAYWVLNFIPATNIAYVSWLLLVYSCVQYPGMLGIFRGILEAYQRYDRSALLSAIQTQIFENVSRILCILLGRWLGSLNPAIGELLGAAIGSTAGKYMKDFVTAILAAHWIRPIIKNIDPSWGIRQLFFVQFDKATMKKCLSFGLRALVPGLISPFSNYIAIMMMLEWLPNYTTILGLYLLGEMLSHLIATFQFGGIGSMFSEAYLNGKMKVTRYYLQQLYRWTSIMGCFMIGLLFNGAPMIGLIAGGQFALVTPIIRIFIIFKLFLILGAIPEQCINGVGHPEYNILLMLCEQGVRLFFLWFFLVVFPSSWLALVLSTGIGWVVKWLVGQLILFFKIVKFKINIWQTFIAPLLAAMVEAIYVLLLMTYLYPIMSVLVNSNTLGAIIMLVIGIFTGPFVVYFPVFAFFGGWDDNALVILERAIQLSGPSKPIILYIRFVSLKIASISPLHNRFPVDYSGVEEEINELIETRKLNLKN